MAYDNNNNTNVEFGWDDEISEEGSDFRILEPGEYNFRVTNFERKRFSGSAKMCACNMAALTLEVDGVNVFDNLYLNKKAEWRMSSFFIAIGQKKHGEPLRPNWSNLIGSEGRCKVGVRKWTGNDGKKHESNEIKQYLEGGPVADEAPAPAYSAPVQQSFGGWQPGNF